MSRYHDRYDGGQARERFFRRAGIGAAAIGFLAIGGFIVGSLGIARALGFSSGTSSAPLGLLLIIFPIFLIIRVFGIARGFGNPLRAVMDAADRVAEGDYTVRVTETGPPPIHALTRSFNTMTSRLQDADRLRRDLMADVAHELRTPLSVLQGRIEGMLDEVYARDAAGLQQLLDETQVLSRLVEDLRTLALSEAGVLPLQKEPIDVTALVRDVARSLSAQHPSIAAPESGELVVDADPVRIREVVSNLIANAIRYTPPTGSIWITTATEGDRVAIVVNDSGRGIAADQLPRLFDRFYKDPESRGSGLGLAIARAIVTAHGGEISATSTPGTGTSIRVTLPR